MDATRFEALLYALSRSPSRRGVIRTLTRVVLSGALLPLLGQVEAKRNKKKRRRRKKRKNKNPPFCAGKNFCTDDTAISICGGDIEELCLCFVTIDTGEPVCGIYQGDFEDCSECSAEQTCIETCFGAPVGCVDPCPNPL